MPYRSDYIVNMPAAFPIARRQELGADLILAEGQPGALA